MILPWARALFPLACSLAPPIQFLLFTDATLPGRGGGCILFRVGTWYISIVHRALGPTSRNF
jgi:hypothetical protein